MEATNFFNGYSYDDDYWGLTELILHQVVAEVEICLREMYYIDSK